jgi:hypothetical protein
MSSRVELTVPVDVDVPAAVLWDAVTDWPGQGEWMLGTRIEMDGPGDGRHLGARSRFLWSELLDLPLGVLGRAGWPVVRPVFRAGVERSLRAMARQAEQRYRAGLRT